MLSIKHRAQSSQVGKNETTGDTFIKRNIGWAFHQDRFQLYNSHYQDKKVLKTLILMRRHFYIEKPSDERILATASANWTLYYVSEQNF